MGGSATGIEKLVSSVLANADGDVWWSLVVASYIPREEALTNVDGATGVIHQSNMKHPLPLGRLENDRKCLTLSSIYIDVGDLVDPHVVNF